MSKRDTGKQAAAATQDFTKPSAVSGVDMAFGGDIDKLLPSWASIPDDFKYGRGNKWVALVDQWFFRGLQGYGFVPKDGIDSEAAIRHVAACMGSFAPKHEHKTAGCAYLLSLWFSDFTKPQAEAA